MEILAIKNGTYRIERFNLFVSIPAAQKLVEEIPFPSGFTPLKDKRIPTSETDVLHLAHTSGMLRQVFGEDVQLVHSRRRRSPAFSFTIGKIHLKVERGTQIEIDGEYEKEYGSTGIHIVEAKIGEWNNLTIRQLTYPYYAEKTASALLEYQ